MNKIFQLIFWLVFSVGFAQSNAHKTLADLPYYENPVNDAYQNERCKLDLYYPEDTQNFPTVIWFHGGGLKSGAKAIPEQLKGKGLGVVAVNYRLHPKVNAPKYIEDAAAAVAWVFKNIDQYGGDSKKIYVCGFSSGVPDETVLESASYGVRIVPPILDVMALKHIGIDSDADTQHIAPAIDTAYETADALCFLVGQSPVIAGGRS